MILESELARMTSALLSPPLGVGVDVVDIADFERLAFADNRRFYERCFSPAEIAYCTSRARPAEHFAVRFAAKEAAVKALGGYLRLAYWQTEVDRAEDGTPILRFWNPDRTAALSEAGEIHALVSLTHSASVAAAVVVVRRKDSSVG